MYVKFLLLAAILPNSHSTEDGFQDLSLNELDFEREFEEDFKELKEEDTYLSANTENNSEDNSKGYFGDDYEGGSKTFFHNDNESYTNGTINNINIDTVTGDTNNRNHQNSGSSNNDNHISGSENFYKNRLQNFQLYRNAFREFYDTYHEYVRQNNSGGLADIELELQYFKTTTVRLETTTISKRLNLFLDNHYDFIVVGSGSSGSVIASRLSENPNWRVLLIEAGKVENLISRIPLTSLINVLSHEYNWWYFAEPQPDIGRAYHRMHIPRGKSLGGSSSINMMIYSRGNPLDYDIWAKQGNLAWSYKDVLPYFLKAEKCHLDDVNHGYHNKHGMVSVERPYISGLVKAFIEAGGEMGYEKYVDYNGPYQDGFSKMQSTLLNGERHSVSRAYLSTAFHRRNLLIVTQAQVTKILIDPHSKSAYGVEYFSKGTHHTVFSKKEVIVSAGAINSPQLLMVSGIGPKDHLADLGIPLLKDLPVGKVLWDHFTYPGLILRYQKPLAYTVVDFLKVQTLSDYLNYRQGPIRSLGADGIAFIRTNDTLQRPDIELEIVEVTQASDFGVFSGLYQQIKSDFYSAYWGPFSLVKTAMVIPILLHPKSKGCVKLRSKDPLEKPLIYSNYLTDREDVKTLIRAIRFIVKMAQSETFKNFGIRLVDRRVPGCAGYGYQSDTYWECALRTLGYSYSHPIGTVKMGPLDDSESVVDHELKVHGIRNLRVADSSIFPTTTGSHPNAPTIMVGEKAADMIKKYWYKLDK